MRVPSMFTEEAGKASATRVIAILFAVVICFGIVMMALRDHLHDAGWPFAALSAVTLLAVPLQALFKTLAEWFRSKPGTELLHKIAGKVMAGPLTTAADAVVQTTTTVGGPGGA